MNRIEKTGSPPYHHGNSIPTYVPDFPNPNIEPPPRLPPSFSSPGSDSSYFLFNRIRYIRLSFGSLNFTVEQFLSDPKIRSDFLQKVQHRTLKKIKNVADSAFKANNQINVEGALRLQKYVLDMKVWTGIFKVISKLAKIIDDEESERNIQQFKSFFKLLKKILDVPTLAQDALNGNFTGEVKRIVKTIRNIHLDLDADRKVLKSICGIWTNLTDTFELFTENPIVLAGYNIIGITGHPIPEPIVQGFEALAMPLKPVKLFLKIFTFYVQGRTWIHSETEDPNLGWKRFDFIKASIDLGQGTLEILLFTGVLTVSTPYVACTIASCALISVSLGIYRHFKTDDVEEDIADDFVLVDNENGQTIEPVVDYTPNNNTNNTKITDSELDEILEVNPELKLDREALKQILIGAGYKPGYIRAALERQDQVTPGEPLDEITPGEPDVSQP